ncbi:hypothetical protein LWI29_022871 [Acer saccharum]|uniref:NB-ARC domain-containing protein n=1 Tax=Acer saccharum TaxID=4024 RepID=A0AA39SJR1_ACESA|nr:hypothetical protein LWI29_022871 [Acer saccharum]
MDAKKIFTVETLSEEESWDMFRKLAGEVVENGEINLIAREVAAYCGGLPLAIETVARALKNKNDRHVWNDAARQLKMSIPRENMRISEKVFATLEPSYNDLESEAKSVFLLCCLFPRDFNIPIELLVRYGMGLGLFKPVYTVEAARDRAHTVVSGLVSSFLLSIVDDDTEKFVQNE